MRIAVVGDSYCPASALAPAFETLAGEHSIEFADVTDEPDWVPTSPSEKKLKEFLGSPRQVIDLLDGHDVLVVQGAPHHRRGVRRRPETQARVRRSRRPGQRGRRGRDRARHPGDHDAGQERPGGGRADDRLHRHARAAAAGGHPLSRGWRRARPGQLRGREVDRPRPRRPTLGLVGYGQVGRQVVPARAGIRDADVRVRPVRRACRASRTGAPRQPTSAALLADVRLRLAPCPGHGRQQEHDRTGPVRPDEARAPSSSTPRATRSSTRTRSTRLSAPAISAAPASTSSGPPDLSIPPQLGRRHRLLDAPNVVIATHIGGRHVRDAAPRRRDGRGGDPAARRRRAVPSISPIPRPCSAARSAAHG